MFLKNLQGANAKFIAKIHVTHAKKVDGRMTPQYSSAFMFKTMVSLFFFQTRSINSFIEHDIVHGNLDRPGGRTLAYYLERTSVSLMNHTLWDQAYTAMRLKQLDGLRGRDGRWTLAFDGVSFTYSTKRHCEKCLETTHDGVTSYHHSLLVASIVNKAKKVSIVVAVIPIENKPGWTKQSCELSAAREMLNHLRTMNPYLHYNITVDGLYLAAEFVDQAVKQGHSVTMPLAKENMVIFKILDVRLGNNRPTLKTESIDTLMSVVYESENIAPYWESLNKLNFSINIYGMKRTILNKKTGEIRECLIVSTIQPNEKNVIRLSDIQREKWQEENKTFNDLKNHHYLKHIFNHKAQAQTFIFAAIATNMRTIAFLRHSPQKYIKKPLTLAAILSAILVICEQDVLKLFLTTIQQTFG